MSVKITEPETWKRVFTIEISAEEVERQFAEKLKKVRCELKLDGFRPGKVPEALVKQRYGQTIRADTVEELAQKAFKEACTENKIVPVSRGIVTSVKDEPGKPLTFSLEAEVDPAIDIKGYKNLKIKIVPKKLKDEDVDKAVKDLQERFAEFKDIDRPSKKGDYIRLEYKKVVIDGQERTDVKNPKYPVELGAEHRLKDFDKGLIGHDAGETVDLSVKFPKDYSDKEVAGKEGEFSITINAVQEKILPEIGTFLKQLGNFENEEALRVDLRKRLEGDALEQGRNEGFAKAIDTLISDNPFEVPPARIEMFFDYLIEEARKERRPGEPLPTREEIDARYRETAIRTIKRQRIMDFISQKEKIAATQEEVDAEIRRLADYYGQPFDTLKQQLRQNGTTVRIREDIREKKTLEFLVELPETAKK